MTVPAARLFAAALVVALAGLSLAEVSGERASGFSAVGFLQTGRSGSVAAVACPAPRRCLALGVIETPYGERSSQQIVVAATADGGRSWHVRSEAAALDDLILPALACPSLDMCYAVGPLFLAGNAEDSIVALASRDGGASWHSVLIPAFAPVGPHLPQLACLTPVRCVMANGEELALTTDAGSSWRVVRAVGPSDWSTTRTLLSCSGRLKCLVVSAASRSVAGLPLSRYRFDLFSTADGGSTWSEAHVPAGEGDQVALSGLTCESAGRCVVSWSSSGTATVSVVAVGGGGWTDTAESTGLPALSAPVCFANSCLATGTSRAGPVIYASGDGGRSWSFRGDAPSGPFGCWSPHDCVAGGSVSRGVGPVAILAWSTNGGMSWNRVPFPVAAESSRLVEALGGP